jgi:hypothetical protein
MDEKEQALALTLPGESDTHDQAGGAGPARAGTIRTRLRPRGALGIAVVG